MSFRAAPNSKNEEVCEDSQLCRIDTSSDWDK